MRSRVFASLTISSVDLESHFNMCNWVRGSLVCLSCCLALCDLTSIETQSQIHPGIKLMVIAMSLHRAAIARDEWEYFPAETAYSITPLRHQKKWRITLMHDKHLRSVDCLILYWRLAINYCEQQERIVNLFILNYFTSNGYSIKK